MDDQFHYQLIDSRFGQAGAVWRRGSDRPPVVRIFLPRERANIKGVVLHAFPGAHAASGAASKRLGLRIGRYLKGEPVDFTLEELDMSVCSAFQRQVLTRTWQIPRGMVVSYGGLADLLDRAGAARAVGTALARNPFPLVIPCHRVVRSGGDLSGFGGGTPLKKALLEMEGVKFAAAGKVNSRCLTR
jgi:methylated-DNA-[protein]-cysteine S-methyltransferase